VTTEIDLGAGRQNYLKVALLYFDIIYFGLMAALRKISLPTLTALSFSGSFVAAKYTTLYLRPLTTTLLRYIIALVLLSLIFLINRKRHSLRVARADLFKMFLLACSELSDTIFSSFPV
jgi:hypothetical protein